MAENFCFNLQCIYKGKTKHLCDILKNARKICSTRKWKFYNIFAKNTHIWVMVEIVPDFSIKEVESFCFHLHCIYKWKTKQRSKNLFNPQMKILQRFATKSYMSESWWKLFPSLVLKKLKAFDFISILSIRGRLNSASLHLKTLEKFVQPANENFTTFCKKHEYESWRKSFPTLY